MPKILIFTFLHMALFTVGGLMLGLSALGVGFSDSAQVRSSYNALVIIWEVFNAPAGVYILQVREPNWMLWAVLQLLTSFLWANLFAFSMSKWIARRHNTSFNPDAQKRRAG